MGDLKTELIAAGCASTPSEQPTVKVSDKRGKGTAKPPPEKTPDEAEEKKGGTTGRFTIHYEVDHQTFALLDSLARHRGQTANQVAANVLQAWLASTWRNISAGR